MKINKKPRFKKIIVGIIYIFITICVTYNVIFFINTSISKKSYFNLFGISLFCMDTELMENDISKNDLVIFKNNDKLQEGDIIVYNVNNQVRINKIFNKKNEYITTKSNKNYYPDYEQINENAVIGKNILTIPFFGLIIKILQMKISCVIVLIYLILILNYNKYKYEKKRERNRKRKKIKNVEKENDIIY